MDLSNYITYRMYISYNYVYMVILKSPNRYTTYCYLSYDIANSIYKT